MGEIFYLDFKSDSFGLVEINLPIGYSDCDFQLNQKDKGYARDISFSGGENQFSFVDYRDHYLEKLLYYAHYFGFEAKVDLIIHINGINNIIGELDFATAITDDLTYFKCKVIQQSDYQIIKRRKAVKVDLLSNKDVNGNAITPLIPQNILLRSKPVVQKSEWTQPTVFNETLTSTDLVYFLINPCQNLTAYGLEDSFTFFQTKVAQPNNPFTVSDFQLLTAKNNVKNIKLKFTDLLIHFDTDVDNGGNGYVDFALEVRSGLTYDTGFTQTLLNITKTELQSYDFSGNLEVLIPALQRGESIWCNFTAKVRQSAVNGLTPKFEVFLNIQNMKTTLTAESTAYNSITPSFRLVDVMAQVIKSISGLTIDAPRYAQLGQFYDNRLFNGNFLRNIKDKPFYVSLEDLEKSITEMNADYEIQSNGDIFFGIEQDFYKPIESGFFDNTQFSGMNKTFNPRFTVNEFNYSYKNYQSLKENEEVNSADTVHGESKWVFFNKMVENKKEVAIEWTRDAFLIESNRRKALEITENTASQDDDKLFCIDTIDTTESQTFNESTELLHTYNTVNSTLVLRTKGEVNFILLGIEVGSLFTIYTPDANDGSYTVFSVINNELVLTPNLGTVTSSANDGDRLTVYAYEIGLSAIPYTNYTNEGFSSITNLNTPDSYSNLRYSVRRNINNYWQSYLATCNLYHKEKNILNTWYKNNGDCTTTYLGDTVTEKSDLLPVNPILSPFLYNDIIFANVEFEDFIALQNSIRSERGFIRTIDNNDRVIKIYPITMKWEVLSKELTIKAEEKFEPKTMEIDTTNSFILINNETSLLKLDWEITDEKVYLFDKYRQRLFNGVYWNNVSIDGVLSDTVEILKTKLRLLE
jgi:hypothetical protein